MSSPSVSVIVSTRNRPDQVGPCVDAILANPGDFELLVIDQSDDAGSERALAPKLSDQRLRYVRSSERGVSNGRNRGIEQSRAPILAFTDDDCRVPADWVANWRAVFEKDPEIGIAFGRVKLPFELQGGFAAEFEPTQREYRGELPPPGVPWGIGASMAARRSLFEKIGLLDPYLGVGSQFPAAEETDLMIRAIAHGFKVVNASEVTLLHLGIRDGSEASKLARGYGVGLGAAFAKHLRLRTDPGALLLVEWVAYHGSRSLKNALLRKRPSGLGFVGSLIIGAGKSLSLKVDPQRGLFKQN